MVPADMSSWRSPPQHETPLAEPSSLPDNSFGAFSPTTAVKTELPSLIPPCEHSQDDGDMHAHAFDLLSLSVTSPEMKPSSFSPIPASVPAHSMLAANPPRVSTLSATRPAVVPTPLVKPRRMSSSTTGVLGRGKLGLTGDSKDSRTNHTLGVSAGPTSNRRPMTGTPPQLFDFTKTDVRKPSASNGRPTSKGRSVSVSGGPIAASLPTKSLLHSHAQFQSGALPTPQDDMELDMAFDGDEEDDDGSLDLEMMEFDEDAEGMDKEEWKKLALGTGSGGVKGRRKGMVFRCENCGKEYRHPSCLIKHRWEHSPHWKEPTQVSMSKHQQVQMLEAAAILAHLDPSQGRALPLDRSLWPAILSPPTGEAPLRSVSDPRNPLMSPNSVAAPLTPSSMRESSTLTNMQVRRTSPGSDSTTSSMGEFAAPRPRAVDMAQKPSQTDSSQIPTSSVPSSFAGPGTPQSVGSLPNEMAGLHFQPGAHSIPAIHGTSPIPNRGMPMSLTSRAGLVGGGMFGSFGKTLDLSMPSSSVRSGALGDDEDEGHSSGGGRNGSAKGSRGRGKSSSEEAEERRKGREGEEWGMAMEMEL